MSTIPQRIGNYELQKLLGSGSIGEVWKSHDLQHRRDVAIKIFYSDLQSDPNFMKRLRSQGQLLVSLRHPNILRILDANMARPKEANSAVAYMVMDYIEGPTLADTIQNTSRTGAFPAVSDIVSLFTQLGAAIDYAHQQGIIHGNIKPANILLRLPQPENLRQTSITGGHKALHYGEPVLTDFGVVRPTNGSMRNSALYISPEQARGLPPTRHSDIYALGVILYEICTGVPPFRSESPVVLTMQHIHMQPNPPTLINANIPSELSTVILRALAKDAATCFSRASELATALADACSTDTVLNNATVEAREPGYTMLGRSRDGVNVGVQWSGASGAQDQRSEVERISPPIFVPTADVSTIERSTGPLSPVLSVSTLPVHASQRAQLQSRQLSVIPHRPTALHVPERVGIPLSTGIIGQVPARAAIKAGGIDMRYANFHQAMGQIKRTPVPFSPPPIPTETPPPMVAIPPSQVMASLSHTPSEVSTQRSAFQSSLGLSGPLALPPPKKVKKLPSIYIWLASTLLLVILGSVVGMLYWLRLQPVRGAVNLASTSANAVVGHIYFLDDSSGSNDTLRIELQNISDPAPGNSYYAWLVLDGQENAPTPMLLGKLPVSSGQVNFLYAGDAQHSDLLANVSGLLITEENASGTPDFSSSKELYTVAFAQTTHPAGANHESVPNAVRDLLSGDSTLNRLGVSGGLAQWLLKDTSKTWLWASNARDYWQGTSTNSSALNFIRGQIVHIVDVLEGKQLDPRDAPIARVALLQSNAAAPAYLDAALSRLSIIASSADATTDQKAGARTIIGELQQVKNWLQKAHQDAIQLLNLTDQQFQQPQTQSLLDDMVMQANDAYNGEIDLPTNATQLSGMAQIFSDMQRLATFDIVPFKA